MEAVMEAHVLCGEVEINGHLIQFAGDAKGYCHAHKSFECVKRLTKEERDVMCEALAIRYE